MFNFLSIIINILFIQKIFRYYTKYNETNIVLFRQISRNNIFNGYDMRILPLEDPQIKYNITKNLYKKILLDMIRDKDISLYEKINIINYNSNEKYKNNIKNGNLMKDWNFEDF
jgi:hypothetical protein